MGEVTCQVKLGQETYESKLLDESIGGVRVGSVPLLALSLNQPVEVTYETEVVKGVCRGVAREAENLYSIGIRREEAKPMDDDSANAMLLNTFMQFSGCDLLCIPVASVNANKVRVMMLGGRQFDVDRSKLYSMTRQERVEKLCSEQNYNNILQVYQLPLTNNAFDARDTIINQEFGPIGQFSLA